MKGFCKLFGCNFRPGSYLLWKETGYNFVCTRCGRKVKQWPPEKEGGSSPSFTSTKGEAT
jgi:hypothetical protein